MKELKEDTLLLGLLCPNFASEMDQVLRRAEIQKMTAQYQLLFDYLSQHTSRNISTPTDVALLYAALETMVRMDYKIKLKLMLNFFKKLYGCFMHFPN